MFHAWVVLAMFSVVLFHGPLVIDASGILAKTPVKVVVVSGTNYEMGVQYGEQAAKFIAVNRNIVWNILDTQVLDPESGEPLGHSVIEKDIQVWTYYLEKHDPELKDWLLGISQGCKNKGFKVSYADLVALMVYPQEAWARPASPYPPETGVAASAAPKGVTFLAARSDTRPRSSCSSFAATGTATQGGKPMVSITGGALLEVQLFALLIAFPTDGERFISLTQAGRVGNNFGMNSKYGWVMPAAVTDPRDCPSSWGVTSEVYFHYLLQYCKSPAEAVEYLNATPRGGVTGLFLFADNSGEVSVYEGGSCTSAIRKPGDLGEKDFVASTNHYNDPSMTEYNLKDFEDEVLGFPVFPDTYPRYATVFEKLKTRTSTGVIDLDFAKALWLSNGWYDATTNTWNTVPVPNDPNDFNTCFVPGNLCEGGEYQAIQFPSDKTSYLQLGVPQGTAIEYYWPEDPKPTGEYTKWQLKDSIPEVASAASDDALNMLQTAWDSFLHQAGALDPRTRQSLMLLLNQATQAWWRGKKDEASAERTALGRGKHKKAQMAKWADAFTNYATAQLYSQMVTTKLNKY
jgi:hypothetical protein